MKGGSRRAPPTDSCKAPDMHRHCPACTRDLGQNEALEHFPVGRRLAFDGQRGRLWVLCGRCRAWNLAPIEERWEAVEEAERLFEGAAEGLATEHIALGRLPEGTELIRIGKAEGPELAGWRYANRISARWRRAQWTGGFVTAGWVTVGPSGFGGALFPLFLAGAAGVAGWQYLRNRHRRLEFDLEGREGDPHARVVLTRGRLRNVRLIPGREDDARPADQHRALNLEPAGADAGEGDGARRADQSRAPVLEPSGPDPGADDWRLEVVSFGGGRILIPQEFRNRALRLSLLELNQQIGRPAHVKTALDLVVEAGDPERMVHGAARSLARKDGWEGRLTRAHRDRRALKGADPVLRLALEIAANEEAERIALEGELARLEMEWQEAEELAAISDSLLIPEWVNRRIAAWRGGEARPGP